MIKRGVISNKTENGVEVFIPEENYAVTPVIPLADSINIDGVKVGDNCIVAFFDAENINFADGIVVAIIGGVSSSEPDNLVGDIRTALDGIISIQNELIGVGVESALDGIILIQNELIGSSSI